MEKELKLKEIYEICQEVDRKNPRHQIEHISKLAEEVGELAQIVNKEYKLAETNSYKEIGKMLAEEIADVIICSFAVGIVNDISYEHLLEVLKIKAEKYKSNLIGNV